METAMEVVSYVSMEADRSFHSRSDFHGRSHGSHHCYFDGEISFNGGSGSFYETSFASMLPSTCCIEVE